ncbi:MAG: glycosyltransferase family 2 protein [Ignavibacteriales bacterium]|nr:glycosyltransferase family 2 protein [Ignavibacteriales bacterium]
MDNFKIDLSVIVVNWNTAEDLDNCLASFIALSDELTLEIIVVDNASEDQSVSMMRSEYPAVNLIVNQKNIGFAAGVNQGIRSSKGKFLLILNPDIVASKNILRSLIEIFEKYPNAGALAPRLINNDGTTQSGYFRKYPSILQILFFYTMFAKFTEKSKFLFRKYMEDSVSGQNSVIEVPQIPGGCIMIRREVLNTAGYMDESYFLFFEDVDWCYRLREHGWRLLMANTVSMTHLGGRSILKKDKEWIYGRFMLSLNQFIDKHSPIWFRIVAKMITFCNSFSIMLVRMLQNLMSSADKESKRQQSYLRHSYFLRMFYDHYIRRSDSKYDKVTFPKR